MRDFRGNNRFGGRSGRPMYQVTCDKCGRSCEVPFQPTGEKPVYCNECFSLTNGRDGNERRSAPSRFGGRNNYRQSRDYGQELATINVKLDKIMKAMGIAEEPEEMTGETEAEAAPQALTTDTAPEAVAKPDDDLMDDLMATEQ